VLHFISKRIGGRKKGTDGYGRKEGRKKERPAKALYVEVMENNSVISRFYSDVI
jgi:hypothetical protein